MFSVPGWAVSTDLTRSWKYGHPIRPDQLLAIRIGASLLVCRGNCLNGTRNKIRKRRARSCERFAYRGKLYQGLLISDILMINTIIIKYRMRRLLKLF